MKLLVLYPYAPWPLDRGTYQRTFHLLKALAQHHQVDFMALVEIGEDSPEKRAVFEAFCHDVEFVPFEHPPWEKMFPQRILNPLPSSVQHWQQPEVAEAINRRLSPGRYDMVHVCDLVLMPYVLPHRHHTPFVVDRSRVDLQFQLMEYQTRRHALRDKALRWEGLSKMWFYEKRLAREARLEVVCGPDDETFIHRHVSSDAPVMVVANGVDLDYFHPAAAPDPRAPIPTVIFCGAMDYTPNVDALDWFFHGGIHGQLLARIPEVEILIVGKNPIDEVKAYGSRTGVTVTGGVPDVRPYYRRAWVQMVPLRIGGGTRLKIVESLAIGTPVISTTIGAQGLELQHGHDILLADDESSFAAEIARALTDETLRTSLEREGISTANQRFGWPAIGARLARHYESLA
ncbi:glycosyltransferase involved in cell wall biosynthesis [Haloferula luteola]|uniref:Glycosyltransferase involved in cell wall biosynthesis n=1 Tax=Haloferula luteola TaxID=595692 RepID=A0A840V816_9BACT|nr:glycosyltransferase family 4 protein [Haloferula luteola]MBB5350878.1 glycosyltransferase involved in cell wall biosynthesis [Haloferula luteola]